MAFARLLVIAVTLLAVPAAAQEPSVEPPAAVEDDPEFGPLVTVQRIDVVGNSRTDAELIRRALLVQEGDSLRTGDPRFRTSRFRVLALGYFAGVELHLSKGSQRGLIVLTVEVTERGTFTLKRVYLGTSEAVPIWAGLDLGDTNLFGTGVGVSAAVVWAAEGDVPGSRSQLGARLRYSDPGPLGAPLGVHATALYNQGSEPVRVAGASDDGSPANFQAFDYTRAGGVAGVAFDLTRLSSLILDVRYERIHADLGGLAGADVQDGDSGVAGVALGFERDTRADPVLPYSGDRTLLVAEGASDAILGDYQFVRLQGEYGRWFSLGTERQVLSIQVGGGVIFGDAPRFDRFYLGDFDPLMAPRALDLVVSTRPPPDFLGTGAPAEHYGDIVGAARAEYAYRLFRTNRRIYGGDLFAGIGLVSLAPLGDREGEGDGLALDVTFNAGMRLDTEIGVFELSLGNALGRIPW